MVREFLSSPLPEGKSAKKVAFIGYDGYKENACEKEERERREPLFFMLSAS